MTSEFEFYEKAKILYETWGFVSIPLKEYKAPSISGWSVHSKTVQTVLPDEARWKSAQGYGILTGPTSKITVVDIDKVHNDNNELCGVKIFEKLQQQYGRVNCPTVNTPSGGYHLYFAYCPHMSNSAKVSVWMKREQYEDWNQKPTKVALDLRNDGGYVCGPGSIYSTKSECRRKDETDEAFNQRCSQSDKQFKQQFTGQPYVWNGQENLTKYKELPQMPDWVQKIYTHDLLLEDDGMTISFVSRREKCKTRGTKRTHSKGRIACVVGQNDVTYVETTDVETVRQLLKHLHPSRCDNRDSWLRVLFALKHTSESLNLDLLPLADEWSQRSSKYQGYEDVQKTYESGASSSENPVTIATLWKFLKEDNPTIFSELQKRYGSEKQWVYEDYMELGKIQEEQGHLDESVVRDFLIHVTTKVLNDGNELWFVKTREHGWVQQIQFPFKSLSSNLKFKTKRRRVSKLTNDPNEPMEECGGSLHDTLLRLQHTGNIPWYEHVDFLPYADSRKPPQLGNTTLNLFTGFPWTPVNELHIDITERLVPILYHLQHILCGGNDDVYQYVLRWLAHLIQRPEEKPGVCLAFKSDQGAGKDMFFGFMEKVIGARYYHTLNDLESLTGKFNCRLQGKLLCTLNEIQNWGGNFRSNDKLKTLLTDTLLYIEPKGKEAYTVHDYCRFIMLSNNDWFVKVDAGDRRYVLIQVSNERCGDFDYFMQLSQAFNQANAELFFRYLFNVSLAGWNIRKLPKTGLKDEFKWNNRESLPLRYLVAVAQSERDTSVLQWPDNIETLRVHLEHLFKDFQWWMKHQNEVHYMTQLQFRRAVEKAGFVCHEKVAETNANDMKRRSGFRLTRNGIEVAVQKELKMPDFALAKRGQ